jgi:hypothetical protein
MRPRPRPTVPADTASRGAGRRSIVSGLLVVLALTLTACAASGTPDVSFDPSTACVATADEGHYPGAYPALEALLPATYEDAAATSVDSGRSCTPETLGTLRERGFPEVHFAGATWDLGNGRGLTVAVFEAPQLAPEQMIEFYEAGARAARRTDDLERSDTTVGGVPATRLDVLYGDSAQTIVAWPAAGDAGRVKVLLAADLGDTKVAELLDRFGTDTAAD